MKKTIENFLITSLIVLLLSAAAVSQLLNSENSKGHQAHNILALTTVNLAFIDPGADPFSGYRWWQEEWDGSQWTNGQNLNDKGDGYYPFLSIYVY